MDVSAIAANGLNQAAASFQKAAEKLSASADPVDAVSLTDAAVAVTQQHVAWSATIKTLKVADDMDREAINTIG